MLHGVVNLTLAEVLQVGPGAHVPSESMQVAPRMARIMSQQLGLQWHLLKPTGPTTAWPLAARTSDRLGFDGAWPSR